MLTVAYVVHIAFRMATVARILLLLSLFAPVQSFAFAPGDIISSDYGYLKVMEFLGRGGTSVVYKVVAFELSDAPQFALKIVSTSKDQAEITTISSGNKLAEREAWGRLPFAPREIKIKIGNDWKVAFISKLGNGSLQNDMDRMKGISLEYRIDFAYKVLSDLLLGDLTILGERKVLHGDIKPTNIVRDSHMKYHLIDFDTARIQGLTSIFSSKLYSAPEIMYGEPSSILSDLYSLGAIIVKIIQQGTGYDGGYRYESGESYISAALKIATRSVEKFYLEFDLEAEKNRMSERAIVKYFELRNFAVAALSVDVEERKERLSRVFQTGRLSSKINGPLGQILSNVNTRPMLNCSHLFAR